MSSKSEKKNLFDRATDEQKAEMMAYSTEYINFLTNCKSDRERVEFFRKLLEELGYKRYELGTEEDLKPSDRFYYLNGSKNLLAGVVGEKTEQFTIVGTHIDFPHIDLKPHFLVNQDD